VSVYVWKLLWETTLALVVWGGKFGWDSRAYMFDPVCFYILVYLHILVCWLD